MSIESRIRTLEKQTRADAEQQSRMVEMVMPWPGEEPRTIMVPRGTIEAIVRIYGPQSPPDPPGAHTLDPAP